MQNNEDTNLAYNKLTVLQEKYKDCNLCDLHKTRNKIVFGIGAVGNILILSEAPGDVEDKIGYPLIGQAGQILDYLLAKTSKNPELIKLAKSFPLKQLDKFNWNWKDFQAAKEILLNEVFYTNTVMCKPPDKRNPFNKEIKACSERLLETIYIVDPVIIITAGKIPLELLLGRKIAALQKLSGRLIDITLPGKITNIHYSVMPIVNPIFLGVSPDIEKKDGLWENTIRSIQTVREIIETYNGMG